ncbi:MAG: RsmE family RNA methyltransferase [Planctomycetota bacterium]|nr:MAG: RsmE family RNA methyltransferase [Planctomycetota bacterium]
MATHDNKLHGPSSIHSMGTVESENLNRSEFFHQEKPRSRLCLAAKMRLFFLDAPPEADGPWFPERSLQRHFRALRLNPGDQVEFVCQQTRRRGELQADGSWQLQPARELPPDPFQPLILATAWPKGNRGDRLVQSATEAGVGILQALLCQRSVAGTKPFGEERIQRWHRLMQETGQQCGRFHLPKWQGPPISLPEYLAKAPGPCLALVPDAPLLKQTLSKLPASTAEQPLSLLIGPEGGFSPDELTLLDQAGVPRAGLLATVLRVEVAGPMAAALYQHLTANPAPQRK